MKLLGVTIDESLNFSRHIEEVCKNASRKVGVLMSLKNMLTTSAKHDEPQAVKFLSRNLIS